MSLSSSLSLLSEARGLLEAIPSWRLNSDHRRSRRVLVAQIDALFLESGVIEPTIAILDDLKARWRSQADIRFDKRPGMKREGDAFWVSAWLVVRPSPPSLDSERFIAALGGLPVMAREVYRLHRIEGRCLEDVGRELGLSMIDVEGHMALALHELHDQLFSQG